MKISENNLLSVLSTISFALIYISSPVLASNTIEMTDIPAAVMKAAKRDSNGLLLQQTYKDTTGSSLVYELRYDDGNKGWIELNYQEDGTLVEKETKISLDQVPPHVIKAIKTRSPGLEINTDHIEKAERYEKGPGVTPVTALWYEFDESHDIDRGTGKRCDVEVNDSGTIVVFEIEPQQE